MNKEEILRKAQKESNDEMEVQIKDLQFLFCRRYDLAWDINKKVVQFGK